MADQLEEQEKNREKDLEEGEIDELEEGEIEDELNVISGYHFSARDEKLGSENDVQIERDISLSKSKSFTHNQRNLSRNTKHSRERDGRRTDPHLSRGYEKVGRKRSGGRQNISGRRRDELLRGNRKYRTRDVESWGTEDVDPYVSKFDNNYPYRSRQPMPDKLSPESNEGIKEQDDDEDFKQLLEQYKLIQEQLDELGPGRQHRSLVDEIIDDSFVDVPLDNVTPAEKPQDDLDAEIRKLELDFSQTNSLNDEMPSSYLQIPAISQFIPTTYNEHNYESNAKEQELSGVFEPFKIKPAQKKVRTLSELNRMDLASRGLITDDDGQSNVGNNQSKAKGKSKTRRRANRKARRSMNQKATSSNQTGNQASNSSVCEDTGVGIIRALTENNSTIVINKQKLEEWQRQQGAVNVSYITSLEDDYMQTPMEVETDSTEGNGIIEELHPHLPPMNVQQPVPQPVPPGDEMKFPLSSNIMPLMDVKPYGHFLDHKTGWWGGPDYSMATTQQFHTDQTTIQYEALPTTCESREIQVNEITASKSTEDQSLNDQQAEPEVEDEASVLALREEVLKSMVTKRAAKNAGKVSKTSIASSVASPSNSRASSPFPEFSTRKGMPDHIKTEEIKPVSSTSSKLSIAPPKHEPVVIHLGADSDESDSDEESPIKTTSGSFFGLDSFIKEARERSSKPKPEAKPELKREEKNEPQPPTPTTPEFVSVLSEEKRNEYKKLKLRLAQKEKQKVLGGSKNNSAGRVKKNSEMSLRTAKNKRQVELLQKEKQKLVTLSSTPQQQQIISEAAGQEHVKLQRQGEKQQLQKQQLKKQQQQQLQSKAHKQETPKQVPLQQAQVQGREQQPAESNQVDGENFRQKENLKLDVKILTEMLLGQKRLITQDQKLLETCKEQLQSSSKALEERQRKVSLLQQQLQQAERLKKVQQDLVEKLKIQNTKLSQRMSKRESDAREVKERLLRTRALLVAQVSQKPRPVTSEDKSITESKPTTMNYGITNLPANSKPTEINTRCQNPVVVDTGEKLLAEVKPTVLKSSEAVQTGGIKPAQANQNVLNVKVPQKIQEMSRIVEESLTSNQKEDKNSSPLKDESSAVISSTSSISSTRLSTTEDKQLLEKKRLRILEQKLSQKLRQSKALRQIGKKSEYPHGSKDKMQLTDERPSSDSELIVKRSTGRRGLTPPVAMPSDNDVSVVDGGLTSQFMMNIFKDNETLEKVKRLQAERERYGPSFTHAKNDLALPARLTSTKCTWLRIEETNLLEHLDVITGCLSAVLPPKPSSSRKDVVDRTVWNRRATGPYRSPLVYFRSYRFSPYYRIKRGFALDSPSFTHLINPHVPFCSFALQGICSDPECRHQHPDDIIPKDKQILEDLAAYFVSRSEKGSGDGDVMKSITRTIDAVTKQYGDKVSPADLRVLFVNDLRKQTSAGVFNIVLEPRTWWPSSHTKKSPETNAQDENPVVQTENTFSWKGWRRRIVNEIKMRSVDQDECQEIRYFSENYDSVKTLEKATQENPSDESLWIRLAMVHMGSNRTEGDSNNNNSRKNVDRALNTLAQALEYNCRSEKLWLKYLDVFQQRATVDELYEVCEQAVELAGSYHVWWKYLEIASDYERKTNVCLKCMEFLVLSDTEVSVKSHRLVEIFLYLIELDLQCDFYQVALSRFKIALNCVNCPRDAREILKSLAANTTCEDLCVLWLSYIHLVEFSCLPREFYDPARTGPARIVRKDSVVFPWKPGGGTRHGFQELLKLFHRSLKECSTSRDKVSPLLQLYKNLIALERASGKDASSVRTCQRLLKASPKNIELWLCLSVLQQVSGREQGVVNDYKKALEACNGHAQIAFCAAKYFHETNNREDCYETLRTCVYSKFVLEVPSPGPTTRARSHDQPTILQPNPELLYKKLLSQTLPLDSKIPAVKPGASPGNLGSELTYIWLCYCMFIELFSNVEDADRHSLTQSTYESAINSTGDRHEVKILWIEYLYYMARGLSGKLCKSEELHDVFHKCLTTVPAVTPVLYTSSRSWSDYSFHNEVLALYRRCSGDAFSSNVYDKYLDLFPDNSALAIQAVEYFYENKELNKSRKILSTILLKTPYCLDLWKMAISIELKEQNFDQARQLYENSTEALPFNASLWKDFALFELAHGPSPMEALQSIIHKAKDRGIDLEDFLKELASKET